MSDLDREQVAACENAYQEALALGASQGEAQLIADLVEKENIDWEEASREERLDFISQVAP